MIFIPRGTYRAPTPIVVPPGEPVVISAGTIHVVRDAGGRELGYLADDGLGTQRSHGVTR